MTAVSNRKKNRETITTIPISYVTLNSYLVDFDMVLNVKNFVSGNTKLADHINDI